MIIDWIHFTPWSSLAVGALIGLAASLWTVANGRVAGISGLIGSLLQRNSEGKSEKALFLLGLLVAPLLWGLFATLPRIEFQGGGFGLVIAGVLVRIGTMSGSGCTSGHGVCGISVAVGMAVTCHPPHRSVRAELPHTAPALGFDAEAGYGIRVHS